MLFSVIFFSGVSIFTDILSISLLLSFITWSSARSLSLILLISLFTFSKSFIEGSVSCLNAQGENLHLLKFLKYLHALGCLWLHDVISHAVSLHFSLQWYFLHFSPNLQVLNDPAFHKKMVLKCFILPEKHFKAN